MKTMKIICVGIVLAAFSSACWAMGNKVQPQSPTASGGSSGSFADSASNLANQIGTNDAVQQMAGDLGEATAKGGQMLANDAWSRHFNQGATQANTNNMLNNATNVYAAGKTVEYAGKAAPHVGWVATSAGRAAEGDYTGAAIEGVNGCGRTVFVSKVGTGVGTAVGVWAGAKLGALAGSWAGPLGAGAGFIVGAGAAYVAGWGWDNTIGAGTDALDQKIADWNAHSQYAGQPQSGGSSGSWDSNPGNDDAISGGDSYDSGVAGGSADIGARDTTRDAAHQSRQSIPRPRPSGGSGGGCTCRPGR